MWTDSKWTYIYRYVVLPRLDVVLNGLSTHMVLTGPKAHCDSPNWT